MTTASLARGIVIRESLRDHLLPTSLAPYVTKTYPYRLDGLEPVEILSLELPPQQVPAGVMALADHLLPRRYYAHIVSGGRLYIVFPGVVCTLGPDDTQAAAQCRLIGSLFGIPDKQMPFEKLFVSDHPNLAEQAREGIRDRRDAP